MEKFDVGFSLVTNFFIYVCQGIVPITWEWHMSHVVGSPGVQGMRRA